eukprot:6192315-Pleurochrysis_carterae.AAC.1
MTRLTNGGKSVRGDRSQRQHELRVARVGVRNISISIGRHATGHAAAVGAAASWLSAWQTAAGGA